MKKKNILKWIVLGIAIAINVFIIVNAFIHGDASAKESNTIAHSTADIINTVKPETITEANFPQFSFSIRKLFGHFGLFALSGGFSTWAFYLFLKETKVGYFLFQILFTILFGFSIAVLSELIQLGADGRTGSWKDIGIDFAGYFIGVLLVILILLILKSPIFLTQKQKQNRD